ncbi:uncharacterized protein I303_100854 [Kwoniella dejecticola CBS 10117]|uniref:GH16 domain-containing protein n=1 Tax=Kwoniella dejecticola CBS 10117 TaxID=1296121 RepID=A0A1A6AG37_9TREE|nr:uncharacterized protein I303_00857 [Kwoniella dejecticola CBS 10117]OBR89035.1 hypothetical protein I303_00857 [Kwoniella dejecticola CBS 10117]
MHCSTLYATRNFVLALPLINTALAATYTLSKTWKGNDFFEGFTWWEWDDPTQGRVNYVNQETAIARNLSYVNGENFVMRGDSTNVVDPSSRGRDSVRIHSKDTYTDGILIMDVKHMPTGCGAWPAFWTCTKAGTWPAGGEVDIIEGIYGINQQYSNNLFTLHSDADCNMPAASGQNRGTGTALLSDCTGGVGCGVRDTSSKSFGEEFNEGEGGIFVMRRSRTRGFSFWFWPHNSPKAPTDITTGSNVIMESLWNTPIANFPADQCDINRHFDDHEIIINLTFAGSWAGAAPQWAASGCAGNVGWTPNDYVDKNPQAFTDAYWEIRSLKWYTPVCSAGSKKKRRALDDSL